MAQRVSVLTQSIYLMRINIPAAFSIEEIEAQYKEKIRKLIEQNKILYSKIDFFKKKADNYDVLVSIIKAQEKIKRLIGQIQEICEIQKNNFRPKCKSTMLLSLSAKCRLVAASSSGAKISKLFYNCESVSAIARLQNRYLELRRDERCLEELERECVASGEIDRKDSWNQ
ncbi:MAG: hypothetical protein MHMPM18_001350 [Marteilia pararefringens]